MPAIFMTHPEHGATHAYSEQEAESNEKNGWRRGPQPEPAKPEPVTLASVPFVERSLDERYAAKFGKRPHWKMSRETILKALEE